MTLVLVFLVFIIVIVFGARWVTTKASSSTVPLFRTLPATLLIVVYLVYLWYEKVYGWGVGSNIRIDLFVILPLLALATHLLLKPYLKNFFFRLIVSIAATVFVSIFTGILFAVS